MDKYGIQALGTCGKHCHGCPDQLFDIPDVLDRLRRKLGSGVIETRRGQGYCVPAPDGP